MLNRSKFFDAIRGSGLFGKSLKQEHVDGINNILNAADVYDVTNLHHVANILAQVHHETGGYMLPIKETVYQSSEDKNPPDATVIARLDKAYAAGNLKWVKTAYWKDGWFGRGLIQLTHKDNYDRAGEMIGVDLIADRSKALDPVIAADIAVKGMQIGLFTGKKLSDFDFPMALQAIAPKNPRRIINGEDGTDKDIAKTHMIFYGALAKGQDAGPTPAPATPTPVRTRSVVIAEIQALLNELKSLGA